MKMNHSIKSLTILALLFSFSSFAENNLSRCKPSQRHFDNYEPETFPTSNNLMRKPGESPLTCGEKLILRGKLLDKNCVPISDAKVYIWQVACDGKYPYTTLRDGCNKNDINTKSNATFTGAGQTTTDNKGEFYFITTYPASFHKKKPSINIRVKHPEFSHFDTVFYTSRQNQEESPVDYSTFYYKEDGTLINEVKIVLPEANLFKEY